MATIDSLPTPALLLDVDVLQRNIDRMAQRAETLGVRLRPHVKTHKCLEIGALQRDAGAAGITVSTLFEAGVFAEHGFDDITWAFPLILDRVDEAVALAGRVRLGLLIDSSEALRALATRAHADHPLRVWIKVDCGYHRAGLDPESDELIALAASIEQASGLQFAGILTHSGHAYHVFGDDARRAVAEQERDIMVAAADRLRVQGIEVPDVSVGSTPATTAARSLTGITEVRPGNYVFYDYTQWALGSCVATDVAVSVLASVVSRMPDHSVVDAGALAMSHDPGPEQQSRHMGPVLRDDGTLDPELTLLSVSQEHGIINRPLPVGTRLRIMPNHSCLTVACFDEYNVIREDDVIDRWRIHRGR
ncbi:MAG: alanine racemase [Acidobacteriota bacterium]|jgi:D-serine deaminase-like pyridoxal phosphate-dependent protein